MNDFVWKPGHSIKEFMDIRIVKSAFKFEMFKSISSSIRKLFKNPKIVELLEFPVLFLGAKPQNTPALYSLMNYADISLGTWYPEGGMYEISKAMHSIAIEQGVQFHFHEPVLSIESADGSANKVVTGNATYEADYVVANADYHHVEEKLLKKVRKDNTKFKETGNKFDDKYLSALNLKYGYAITCHKAQGGEWDEVVILPYYPDDDHRWIYTAVTRARKRIYSYSGSFT